MTPIEPQPEQTRVDSSPNEVTIWGRTFFRRNPEEFLRLPLKFRWEFTRRHPYYLRYWMWATSSNPANASSKMQRFARAFLLLINCTGDPENPEREYSELDSSAPNEAYAGGALAGLTHKNCLKISALALSPAALETVGRLFQETARAISDGEPNARNEFAFKMDQLRMAELDLIPNPTAVWFRPDAPLRAITEDLKKQLNTVKLDLNIAETRRREDKLPEYLKVWDLREGWKGNRYDPSQELSFKEISRRLKLAETTVFDHYKSAFRSIFGHDYSPRIWWASVATLKWESMTETSQFFRATHPLSPRSRRDVPAATLGKNGEFLVETLSSEDSDSKMREIAIDLKCQIQAGQTDKEIVRTLNCSEKDGLSLVKWFRDKLSDSELSKFDF